MQYKVWNRTDVINGKDANYFLNKEPFKNCTGDIILISNEAGKVTQIECKEILAKVYGINVNLSLNAFMAQYFAILEEQNSEAQTEA